ncbi:MAG: hypothetical protein AB8C46_08825 [Burkholderiaceae bacterium]
MESKPVINRDNWGWRARLGLFIVASEAVPEAEWWAMMPDGVSVHTARVNAPAPWAAWQGSDRTKLSLSEDVARGADHFASMRLNVVVVGHSSSSILGGEGWDDAVVHALREKLPAETQVTTNGFDCVAALRASGINRPLLVIPPWFGREFAEPVEQYFASLGFSPAGSISVDPGRQWRDVPPAQLYPQGMGFEQDVESLYRQIRSATPKQADGVLIVGTGLRCVGIIEALESDLRRPVITANQASLWHCLRLAGIRSPVAGYGGLLSAGIE